jgi:hypothetical protein
MYDEKLNYNSVQVIFDILWLSSSPLHSLQTIWGWPH